MADTHEEKCLPAEKTGWTAPFPILDLYLKEVSQEDIDKAYEKVKLATSLKKEEKYEKASDLFSEALEVMYQISYFLF